MQRSRAILALGVLMALLAYVGFYFVGSVRHQDVHRSQAPELEWLKTKFHLTESQFARVQEIHKGYLPECRRMCGRVDAKNEEIRDLIAGTNSVTPGIEKALREAAALRSECQTMMFRYFFEVSKSMPEAEGRRYLQWVQDRTLDPSHGVMDQSWLGPTQQ